VIENSDVFQLLAEIAVTVAGFAGVATVFGGQERSFEVAENLRLRALFQFSAQVFICCLGVLAMDAAKLPRELIILVVSIAAVIITSLCALDVPWKATKLRAEMGSSVTPLSLLIGFSPSVIGVPILLINALLLRQEWLLIAVFSYFILIDAE
jgi:hypothetical protein